MKFRLLMLPLATALLIVGVTQLRKAPVDVLPEFTLPVVQVQTEALGLSAAEVEELITDGMEQDVLNGVRGAREIRSSSVAGLSEVTLVFDRGTSPLEARQLVQERLIQVQLLPQVSRPPQIMQSVSSTGRVMMIGLSSKKLTPIQLSVLARWTVRPRLLGLSGVANVAIWGQRERQLQVKVDPRELRAKGVTLSQVVRTTGNAQLVSPLSFVEASTPGTGGFIDGKNQRLGVRHILPFGRPDDLAQVPMEGRHGLRLGDVAKVSEDHQPLIGDAVVNGGNGLLLVVEKLPGANTLDVTRRVEKALGELRPGLTDVTVDSRVFRPATFIESAMSHLQLALLIAAGLLVAALTAFFMQWRPVFVALVTVPLSLVAAGLVIYLTGGTLNALVVAGLVVALGIVVDDAVGDSENIARRVRQSREAGASTASVIFRASLEMRRPLGYATLIVLLAMVPVFFAAGQSGAFVHPLALSYVVAVAASMAVALLVTPALSALVWTRPPRAHRGESAVVRRIHRHYAGALASTLRTPGPAILGFGLVALAGLAVAGTVDQHLRPAFKDRQLLIHWTGTPGMSLPEMDRITTRATKELRALPGVGNVGAHVGRAVTSDQAVGANSGEIWVTMRPGADYESTAAAVRDVARGTPGFKGEVLTYERDRDRGVLTRADHPLVVRVYGHDYNVLQAKAEELRKVVSTVKGVEAPRVAVPVQQPTLEVQVDIARARRHDIKPGDVRRAAATLVNGLEVGQFFEQQKVFEVVVRGVRGTRNSVDSIRNLLIDTPGHGQVRLADVASVRIRPNPVTIRHADVSRYTDVIAGVRDRSLVAIQDEVQRRLASVSMPLEYHAAVVRPSADVAPSGRRMLSLVIGAAIGMFLLLQAAFSSWRLATLVFLTLPMAVAGGLVMVFVSGAGLSLGAAAGLFTVLAIAVRHAVVLVTRYRELGEAPGAEAIAGATRERLVPVAMTVVATGLAMAPFVALGDIAGNEITHSMALVIVGGLVTAAVLNLLVLPSMYLHLGSRERLGVKLRARTVSSTPAQADLNA